jgi:uncharacterized protein involved in cysteine biosynthesis
MSGTEAGAAPPGLPEAVVALARSLRTLARPGIWLYVIGPALLAFVAWIVIALVVLDHFVALLLVEPPLSWIAGLGAVWLAKLLALLGGWALVLAVATLTATLLAAVFVLPLLLRRVAASDYPELAAMGRDSSAESTVNSVLAALFYALAWLVTIPLWLIPGVALVLPVLLLAWLNRRTFAYDSLAVHASDDERRQLLVRHRWPLFTLGAILALLAHVPLLGLLVPTLAVLAYVHYCLEALRQLRRGAIVTVTLREKS